MQTVAVILASLLFLTGLAGSVIPALPDAPLILAGMLVYGLLAGFDNLPLWFFAVQACLAAAIMGIDYLATALGSRYFGGSRAAFWGGIVGLVIGFFFFPIGLLAGPFLGALLAELLFTKNPRQSLRSGIGALIGFWSALPFKLGLGIVMIAWFFIRIL